MYMLTHLEKEAYWDVRNMFKRMIVKGDWDGGTDINGDIRTAKNIRYDSNTWHGIKTMGANWLHSVIIKLFFCKFAVK